MKLLASLLMAAALVAPAFSASAADAPAAAAKPDLVKGQASFSAVCVACHGADGNSSLGENPSLAQQHPEYLVKQLQEFKSGKRVNAIMQGFAGMLTEEDMKNISWWVAGNQAAPGFAQDKDAVALGERILPRRYPRPQHRRLRFLPQPQRRWHSSAIPTPERPACPVHRQPAGAVS